MTAATFVLSGMLEWESTQTIVGGWLCHTDPFFLAQWIRPPGATEHIVYDIKSSPLWADDWILYFVYDYKCYLYIPPVTVVQ